MIYADAPPLWVPQKPAIIRSVGKLTRGMMAPPPFILAGYQGVNVEVPVRPPVDSSAGPTITFTNVDLGTPSANRLIVVTAGGGSNSNASRSISSITIAGTLGTLHQSNFVQGGSASGCCAIASRVVPTGATGTIVVTYNGAAIVNTNVVLWCLTNYNSATPTASTGNNNQNSRTTSTVTTTMQNNGLTIAVSNRRGGGSGGASSWDAFFLVQYDLSNRGNHGLVAWGENPTASQLLTCTYSATDNLSNSVAVWR